ncbi:hypothetical protein HNP48_002264 [Acidovorax soli]|uniref:Uncharacterized protein n=1 Tax=Acidovorax soli TaxID=592050 RepID=A0A7X0PDJ4_9BURK|nr:hypothetical protein [Acidovorax soli]MBB6559597.1 hypothetical protein [Acidovorax soli]
MSNAEPDQIKRPPSDRGQGRNPIPPEQKAISKSVGMTQEQWAMFHELGGNKWLRATVEAAHKRLKKPKAD